MSDTPSRDALERGLCELFAAHVGVDAVHREDDFFDIGGHSLLAAEVVGVVRRQYEVSLKLRDFIEAPTAADLGELIMRQIP